MVKSQSNQYTSSTVKSSTYNYEHKTLVVHFSHASYMYQGVEVSDYQAFATADSQGKALNDFIKPGYPGQRMSEAQEPVLNTNL